MKPTPPLSPKKIELLEGIKPLPGDVSSFVFIHRLNDVIERVNELSRRENERLDPFRNAAT